MRAESRLHHDAADRNLGDEAERLRTAVPGSVTLSGFSAIFSVTSTGNFFIENLRLAGNGTGMGVHVLSGRATVTNSTFTGFKSFALSVHSLGQLTVTPPPRVSGARRGPRAGPRLPSAERRHTLDLRLASEAFTAYDGVTVVDEQR